jgi:predicted acylesterase/phospholipase RssA
MSQRGLSVRFWIFLAIAVIAGVIVFDLVVSLGARVGSGLPKVADALELVWAVLALLIAVTIGSVIWNLLYWLSGQVSLLTEERLTLSDFGRRERVEEKPEWAKGPAKNAGNLGEFLALGDDPEFRIGIVLAGGGAKGVYQAGALRALWEFLEKQNALKYVRMIAGTSIGSWNAMFWLTRQVSAGAWDQGPLYEWWTSSRLSTVVNPAIYIPILRNYLAGNQVWRAQFTTLFSSKSWRPLPYLYLTRTNVESALLDFTASRMPQPIPPGALPNYRGLANTDHSQDATPGVKEIESSVFASMDIPPAFRRLEDVCGNHYEDGGVIDNLPIQFATWCEGCNLLFVFPLNATFAGTASEASILKRMARVLDMRQGALERAALKDISLYNQIIAADQKKANPGEEPPNPPNASTDTSKEKLSEVHSKPSTTFCICPGPDLEVGTFGFGSLKRYGRECYRLMYKAISDELARFDFSISNQEVWMAKVSSDAKIKYKDFTVR